MISIRQFDERDWQATWRIIEPVFRAGDSYTFLPDISEADSRQHWIDSPLNTFVAESASGEILGTYFIRPNQPGLGSHVCNCGYIVSEVARGQGIASEMCEHSQRTAINFGFRAMQYNMVVAANEGAVRLWQKHGFEKIGTLPGAFKHSRLGYVDAHVMYKQLVN
jgi:RimJ/RimL family protein N-acetyltransferase